MLAGSWTWTLSSSAKFKYNYLLTWSGLSPLMQAWITRSRSMEGRRVVFFLTRPELYRCTPPIRNLELKKLFGRSWYFPRHLRLKLKKKKNKMMKFVQTLLWYQKKTSSHLMKEAKLLMQKK